MVARTLTIMQMLPELNAGGVERGTVESARYQVNRGHRAVVVSGGGRLVERLTDAGAAHVALPVGSKSPRALAAAFSLRRVLLDLRPDVLHLRSRVPAWAGLMAVKSLAPSLRPVVVTTFHGFYSVNAFSAVMTRGERVIAISGAVARHIRKRYGVPSRRITVIHRGVDDKAFNPTAVPPDRIAALRGRWGVDPDETVILLPARITGWKGHDLLIRALSRIRDRSWACVCVGDPADNPALHARLLKLAKDGGIGGRVLFPGLCDDMPTAYAAADIAVSCATAQAEAFGRTAVEAQAMERPVIATAHGGSLETVLHGRTGWLTPPGDPDALAGFLTKALENPAQRKDMGRAGRQWVLGRFTSDTMCRRTLELYEELLDRKSAAKGRMP